MSSPWVPRIPQDVLERGRYEVFEATREREQRAMDIEAATGLNPRYAAARPGDIDGPPGVGVGVMVESGLSVLLGQRINSHGAGFWSLPGGKVDPGETPRDAAYRELLEETNLVAWDIKYLPLWTYDRFEKERLHFITLYLSARVGSTDRLRNMEPEKCAGWSWHHWDSLPSPLWGGVALLAR